MKGILAYASALASLLCSAGLGLQGETATATVPAGVIPFAVAVNPVTNKIYVANASSAFVTVIDGANNSTSNVNAGGGPISVAVNPVTNKIYAANSGTDNVVEPQALLVSVFGITGDTCE